MKSTEIENLNIHPLLLALLFALNIVIVVVYQFFFVYTVPVPDTEILGPNGNYDPDFSDVPFFSDKEILDSLGWIFEEIVLYQNEDGTVEVVRLKQNILFGRQYALETGSISDVPNGGVSTVIMRNFLGKDEIVVSNQSEIISIKGYGIFRSESTIVFTIGLSAFLLLALECFLVAVYQKSSKTKN